MSDVYDRLRPADEHLDDVTFARIWNRITSDSVEDVGPVGDVTFDEPRRRPQPTRPGDSGPTRRRFGSWAAAAAVIAGLVATATVINLRSPSDAPLGTAPRSDVEPSPVPDATAASTRTRFAVADNIPDGWILDHLEAAPSQSLFGTRQWAITSADGDVTGVVSVRPPRPLTPDEADAAVDGHDSIVRGRPASQWNDETDSGLSGVTWVEGTLQMQVTATGSARGVMRDVVEALVIDEASRSVSIPDELGLVPADELGLVDPSAVTTTIGIRPTWTIVGGGLTIRTEPNTFGFSLDRLIGTHHDRQSMRIDDRDAQVVRTDDGTLAFVSWLDDGMHIVVSTTLALSDDEMIDVVRGVRFTDANEFDHRSAALAERIVNEVADWIVHDTTMTTDGLEVTVRSRPDSGGAGAICIEEPSFDCVVTMSEGGIADGFEPTGAAGFDIGERSVGVVWIATDLLDGVGDPSLRASDVLNPADGYNDGTTAVILADTITDHGRFVIVDLPDGERPPTIHFSGTGTALGDLILVELTPAISGNARP